MQHTNMYFTGGFHELKIIKLWHNYGAQLRLQQNYTLSIVAHVVAYMYSSYNTFVNDKCVCCRNGSWLSVVSDGNGQTSLLRQAGKCQESTIQRCITTCKQCIDTFMCYKLECMVQTDTYTSLPYDHNVPASEWRVPLHCVHLCPWDSAAIQVEVLCHAVGLVTVPLRRQRLTRYRQ